MASWCWIRGALRFPEVFAWVPAEVGACSAGPARAIHGRSRLAIHGQTRSVSTSPHLRLTSTCPPRLRRSLIERAQRARCLRTSPPWFCLHADPQTKSVSSSSCGVAEVRCAGPCLAMDGQTRAPMDGLSESGAPNLRRSAIQSKSCSALLGFRQLQRTARLLIRMPRTDQRGFAQPATDQLERHRQAVGVEA